jgi:hypothetical protein
VDGIMTWHHVALIMIAAAMVLVCGVHNNCSSALPSIVQLATVIVSGALGHAGAGLKKAHDARRPDDQERR